LLAGKWHGAEIDQHGRGPMARQSKLNSEGRTKLSSADGKKWRRQRAYTTRDPKVVMERILDAAQAEFMSAGYEAASTNAITAAFGGSKATLFRYFPTKQEMVSGVVRRIGAKWRGIGALSQIEERDPGSWLVEFGKLTLEWLLNEEVLFVSRFGIGEGPKIPGSITSLRDAFPEVAGEPLQQMLREKLRDWTAKGLLQSKSFEQDAIHFFDLTFSGAISRALYGFPKMTSKAIDTHVRRCVDLFLHGRGL
jgi:TetR/AcrR family transcriptional regulator, mexJK operon transcriptional repressor